MYLSNISYSRHALACVHLRMSTKMSVQLQEVVKWVTLSKNVKINIGGPITNR
jgi:hypothetical protein